MDSYSLCKHQLRKEGIHIVKIIYDNGIPFIDMDGQRFEPAAFRSFRPRPDNVSLIARAGVKLCQILVSGLPCTLGVPYSLYGGVWKGDGVYDFTAFDNQFAMFRRHAPDAYFNVMLQLDVCPWFAEAHPDEETHSYNHITEVALNEEWKRSAADYLKAFITYAEEKYGDHIWAYSFAAGCSNEWFDMSLYDTSFDRENTRLTALWRDVVGRPDAPIPTIAFMDADASVLRAPDSDDYRYLKLATEQTSNLICYFAKEAQSVLHHNKLIGLFYGYIDLHRQVYWNTCGYETVWRCPDIDMLYSPAAYFENRRLDGVSSYQYAVDSIYANGKLYLHENDHRTDLARFPLENGTILTGCYNSFAEWREVFRRELCNVMQKRSAFWWFDFFGGYYGAPEYEAELKLEADIFRELSQGERESAAEIAVFVDPMSMLCTKERTQLCVDLGRQNINALLRCGAPFDYYNLSDLPRLDISRYKLFVFLNAFILSDEIRTFIDEKLTEKKRVFVHGAGLWNGKSFDTAGTSALCGMKIVPHRGTSLSYYGDIAYHFTSDEIPLFEVADPDTDILAYYEDGGISCARKGSVVYSAVGQMPWQLWRDIAADAGVHIYDSNGGGTAICSQFVCAYTTLREDCELHMKEDGRYRELFSGEVYECRNGLLRYHAPKGTTMLFVRIMKEN